MLDVPQIIETADQPMASIHLQVPRADIRSIMGATLAELHAAVAAQNIPVAGPWFTHHLKIDPAMFDFEICLPVNSPISPDGRVKPGTWPAMKVVRAIYRGGYEGLGPAWGKLDAWILENKLKPAQDLWERYIVGPEAGDAAQLQTELNRPLQ